MPYISGQPRKQKTLLPDCIDDIISQDNPVRVIDAFINEMDMNELEFIRPLPKDTGRPGYDPRYIFKLYIYGYFNNIRSSRKLMAECDRNIEVFFLLNRLVPDFRTISNFRKNNSSSIKLVFQSFADVCKKLNPYKKQLIAIDGTKIKAVKSKMNSYNKKPLQKEYRELMPIYQDILPNWI